MFNLTTESYSLSNTFILNEAPGKYTHEQLYKRAKKREI